MAMFLVVLRRSGPQWDASRPLEEQSGWPAHASFMDGLVESGVLLLGGPLADEQRVVYAAEAESEAALCETLARDRWHETHLRLDSIEPWTIRLDARRRGPQNSFQNDAWPDGSRLHFEASSLVQARGTVASSASARLTPR